MDLKTRLENERLFYKKTLGKNTIRKFNEKGIFTVEDFINCDIDVLIDNKTGRTQYRAYQKILRYKYLGEPLVLDVLLDKEYNENNVYKLARDLENLGFGHFGADKFQKTYVRLTRYVFPKEGTMKLIDVISKKMDYQYDNLKEFYTEYYNDQKKKEEITEEKDSENITELDKLKNDLICLLNQRNQLDSKIQSLLQQINTLEGGRSNGK